MYGQPQNLGDWKSFIKKTRDLVHKAFPRELSPTRMLEKYASDTKKKNAAKLAKVATQSEAANAAADASTQARITALQTQALPVFAMNATSKMTPQVPEAASIPASDVQTDWVSYGAIAAVVLGAVIVFSRRGK